jgi:hypothetical protein
MVSKSGTATASSGSTFTLDPSGNLWLGGFIAVTNNVDVAAAVFFMSEADVGLTGATPINCEIDSDTLFCSGGVDLGNTFSQVGTDSRYSTTVLSLGNDIPNGYTFVTLNAVGVACSNVAPVPN